MYGRSEISFTWGDVMNDLTDRYFIYGPNEVQTLKEKFMAGNHDASFVISTRQNGIPKGRLLSESSTRDGDDGQRGSNRPKGRLLSESSTGDDDDGNRPSNASVEDSSTDSINQIGSAIEGKASRPPRPEKTPQARRQSVTGFINSIFKYKKQMEIETFGGTDEAKPAGSDSSDPRPTTLGLARIFPYEELMEATNGFKQQVGEGGFSSVYLGKLRDKREVAVKVLYDGIKKRFEQFINEVTVLSRLRHQNLVSLYGCTDPETHKLLIVYEFVPNDTLASHLHGDRPPLSWALRIQIAIEIAMALVYLHSQVPSLIHRDVKSSNILLDNDFHPKLADFGMCRLVPWDTTYVSTLPQGTVGYRDPEYDLNFKLTDKSDVYSFGVVLLELISGKQAVDVNRDENEIYLFKMALSKILNKNLWQLVDLRLEYDSESETGRMINSVAELACVCLQPEANKRPPMAEVLMALNGIKSGIQ